VKSLGPSWQHRRGMAAEDRAQAVDLVILEERSGDFGESRRPMMMMSDAVYC
jgi:hypothetical protein